MTQWIIDVAAFTASAVAWIILVHAIASISRRKAGRRTR